MEEQHAGHETDALTITYFLVQQGVGFQQVEERELSCAQLSRKVGMGGESPSWDKTRRGEVRSEIGAQGKLRLLPRRRALGKDHKWNCN